MTGYITLTRQSGLAKEIEIVANNIANLSTNGFRREGVIFTEFVHKTGGSESVSLAAAQGRRFDTTQGPLTQTNARFDLAIEGDGFFLVETSDGQALTRAGSFTPNSDGELVTPDGLRLLDDGGAPVFVPPDANSIRVAPDGTLSADGAPLSQIGVYLPSDPNSMARQAGTIFKVEDAPVPAPGSSILQGFLEGSNVSAVSEIARMIQVQRAYELGARFQEQEGERRRSVIETLGR